MKKLTATIAAALLLAACAEKVDPAQQFRDALPTSAAVHIGAPQDEGGATGALSAARQPIGETAMAQSEYALMSYHLALSVNGGAALILDMVRYITTFPTSSCDASSCTWGPWAGDNGWNNYKLVVTKVATDTGPAFDYALSGQNGIVADAPFVDILTGRAYPVDRDHGSGSFTLDFDASYGALAHPPGYPQKDFGLLVLTYDNTQNPIVGAQFIGGHKEDGDSDPTNDHIMNAAYSFEDAANGGQLLVAFADLDTTEVVNFRTRWSAGGAGRSDAHYNGPDGQGGRADYHESECWAGHAQNFVEVYDSYPPFGDESLCSPFSTAQWADGDISLP